MGEGGGFLNQYMPDTTSPPHDFYKLSQAFNEEQKEIFGRGGTEETHVMAISPLKVLGLSTGMMQAPFPTHVFTHANTIFSMWPWQPIPQNECL